MQKVEGFSVWKAAASFIRHISRIANAGGLCAILLRKAQSVSFLSEPVPNIQFLTSRKAHPSIFRRKHVATFRIQMYDAKQFRFQMMVPHMTTTAQSGRRVYGPRGVAQSKPVQMRLLPIERYLFNKLKEKLGMSESSLSREIYLVGLPTFLALHGLTEWANAIQKAFSA
ncbi:hypothetical protein BI343_03105 [Chromobacterium amazonense]|nr:hypothetical protein BI343_03105 [Chromobacterium amazonense]